MTIRERNGRFQAIIVLKKDGAVVYQEAATFSTRRLAEDWKERTLAKIHGRGIAARVKERTCFADLIDDFRDEREKHKPLGRSLHADLDQLKRWVGSTRLQDLDEGVFTKLARKRRDDGVRPATVMHNLATARVVLNAAKPMFDIDISGDMVTTALKGLALVGMVSRSSKRDRRPTPEELDALEKEFERVSDHPSTVIPMATIVRLAVTLPRRLGELCAMRWEDYKEGTLTLHDTKHPRNPRREVIPVPPKAAAIIDSLPKIDERVLPYEDRSVSKAFSRACERLGIVDLRFHDLRHEGVSRLFEQGLGIPEVSMISGHMTWANLKRYTHLRPQDVVEKLKRAGSQEVTQASS